MASINQRFPFIPRSLRQALREAKRFVNLRGKRHRCYLCGETFARFYPYRGGNAARSGFIRDLETVGSDLDNFRCPGCGGNDRHRHLAMYFDRLGIWRQFEAASVLHFAAESSIERRIMEQKPREYIKADLNPKATDVREIDATAIPFQKDTFDWVICNHVLEHISDDRRALKEIFRVLKAGGRAVLQTPYSMVLAQTFCDPAIDTDEMRMRYYGQEDHVRVYGRDLFLRMEEAGFLLTLHEHGEVLPDVDPTYHGVNADEPLILVSKQ